MWAAFGLSVFPVSTDGADPIRVSFATRTPADIFETTLSPPVRSIPRPWFLRQASTNSKWTGTVDPSSGPLLFSRQLTAPEQRPFESFPHRVDPQSPRFDDSALTIERDFQWSKRNRISACDDLCNLPFRWGDEIASLATCENAVFLGIAGGAAVILHNNVDQRANREYDQNGPQGGHFSNTVKHGGDTFAVHVPLMAGIYATSLWHQDEDLHELALTMFASYKFTVLSTLAIQYGTGTHRSNGGFLSFSGDSGFPSQPTATTFAIAAVVDEAYGWTGGVPAYIVAGLIGWAEIDQHQHTVSEVAFGAALGYAIGKSIGALHYHPDTPFKLVPFSDINTGTQGMGFEWRY